MDSDDDESDKEESERGGGSYPHWVAVAEILYKWTYRTPYESVGWVGVEHLPHIVASTNPLIALARANHGEYSFDQEVFNQVKEVCVSL